MSCLEKNGQKDSYIALIRPIAVIKAMKSKI